MVSGCTMQGPAATCRGCRCPLVSLPAIDRGDWSLWQEVGGLPPVKTHTCALVAPPAELCALVWGH